MSDSKVDEISAWSILQLIRQLSDHLQHCPICWVTGGFHQADCNLGWHLKRLEVETGEWMPRKIEEEDGA